MLSLASMSATAAKNGTSASAALPDPGSGLGGAVVTAGVEVGQERVGGVAVDGIAVGGVAVGGVAVGGVAVTVGVRARSTRSGWSGWVWPSRPRANRRRRP